MDQDKKRELRQLKRDIKRAGNKHRRRELKQGLIDDPEGARDQDAGFGRHESSSLNGIDRRNPSKNPPDHAVDPVPGFQPRDRDGVG